MLVNRSDIGRFLKIFLPSNICYDPSMGSSRIPVMIINDNVELQVRLFSTSVESTIQKCPSVRRAENVPSARFVVVF